MIGAGSLFAAYGAKPPTVGNGKIILSPLIDYSKEKKSVDMDMGGSRGHSKDRRDSPPHNAVPKAGKSWEEFVDQHEKASSGKRTLLNFLTVC